MCLDECHGRRSVRHRLVIKNEKGFLVPFFSHSWETHFTAGEKKITRPFSYSAADCNKLYCSRHTESLLKDSFHGEGKNFLFQTFFLASRDAKDQHSYSGTNRKMPELKSHSVVIVCHLFVVSRQRHVCLFVFSYFRIKKEKAFDSLRCEEVNRTKKRFLTNKQTTDSDSRTPSEVRRPPIRAKMSRAGAKSL